jgi:carbamoyltransferase
VIVLGVNAVYHETAAAVVIDGEVVAAVEEERFNRRKHGAEARVDNPHELPADAIRFCLQEAGVDGRDLDAVCYSFDPAMRRDAPPDPHAHVGGWGDPIGEAVFLASLDKVADEMSMVLDSDVSRRLQWIPHHVSHAASSYYRSPFDEAAVLVADGIGERDATVLFLGTGNRLAPIRRFPFPHSVGFLWEKLSKYLGFTEYDACKVMGLAGYGDAIVARERLTRVVQHGKGWYAVDDEVIQFRRDDFDGLARVLGPPGNGERLHGADLAAALQQETNAIMLSLAWSLYQRRPGPALCLAGGVALNCTTNSLVKEAGPFRDVYIPSSPNDAGTAVGAALYYHHQAACGLDASARAQTDRTPSPYLGPQYDDRAIDAALRARGWPGRWSAHPELEAARMVASGRIVGWFQGRMEFGPRALGNRSLLADPRDPDCRNLLNRKVKHREEFRPFAPSVLAERARDWLEIGKPSASYEYMLFACPVRRSKRDLIPAVVHIDGTARAQLVVQESNPLFHRLISQFERLTGVPVILNTSFNDSEPIVCTPDDALDTFLKTGIDAMVLGRFVVEKPWTSPL